MAPTEYKLSQLAPRIPDLLSGEILISSPEGLSAAFVLALLFAVALFGLISIWSYIRAVLQLRFYRGLIKGVSSDQLLERQRDITQTALQNKRYGQLWREFDESLVHVPHRDRLFNTLDAAHFFNTHTISSGLTESRLLAAVPGFLTAIGVIGTFAGLQMGLANLSGSIGSSPEIEELKTGIFGMIGGASIAFMTSVWGVFTSVLFNFCEKMLERNIRASIAAFQNQVDYLYPRITAEQSLSNIEDFSRQSTEKLAELDEKIGHRLQEAMRDPTLGWLIIALSADVSTVNEDLREYPLPDLVAGQAAGVFHFDDLACAADMVVGTVRAGLHVLLSETRESHYIDSMSKLLLIALGVVRADAHRISHSALPIPDAIKDLA